MAFAASSNPRSGRRSAASPPFTPSYMYSMKWPYSRSSIRPSTFAASTTIRASSAGAAARRGAQARASTLTPPRIERPVKASLLAGEAPPESRGDRPKTCAVEREAALGRRWDPEARPLESVGCGRLLEERVIPAQKRDSREPSGVRGMLQSRRGLREGAPMGTRMERTVLGFVDTSQPLPARSMGDNYLVEHT